MNLEPRKAPPFKASEETVKQYYLSLIPVIRLAAYPCGYAISVHGTQKRDLDIIAIPWKDDAKTADELVGKVLRYLNGDYEKTGKKPGHHPHGRLVWTLLHKRGKYFIDFGVMPRLAE